MAATVMRIWPRRACGEGGRVRTDEGCRAPDQRLQRATPPPALLLRATSPPALLLFPSTLDEFTPFLPDPTCSVNLGKTQPTLGLKSRICIMRLPLALTSWALGRQLCALKGWGSEWLDRQPKSCAQQLLPPGGGGGGEPQEQSLAVLHLGLSLSSRNLAQPLGPGPEP